MAVKLIEAGPDLYEYEFPREDLKKVLEAIRDVYGNKADILISNMDTDYENHDYRGYPDMNAFIEDWESFDPEMKEDAAISFHKSGRYIGRLHVHAFSPFYITCPCGVDEERETALSKKLL